MCHNQSDTSDDEKILYIIEDYKIWARNYEEALIILSFIKNI